MSWLEFLCAAGWQHMMDGDAVRGAECLGFARFRPSMARYGIGIIENIILPWVGHRLPPDELATAMKRGKGLDLQALLASLDFGAVP